MSVYFNYGLSQNRILIIMTDFKDGEGEECMERLLFKKMEHACAHGIEYE